MTAELTMHFWILFEYAIYQLMLSSCSLILLYYYMLSETGCRAERERKCVDVDAVRRCIERRGVERGAPGDRRGDREAHGRCSCNRRRPRTSGYVVGPQGGGRKLPWVIIICMFKLKLHNAQSSPKTLYYMKCIRFDSPVNVGCGRKSCNWFTMVFRLNGV